MSSLSAGCCPNIEVPVWLDDSSGVVVGEEFLQIQNGAVKVTKLTSPAICETGIEKAQSKTRQMASFQVQVNGTSKSPTLPFRYFNGKAEVKLCIRSLATPDVADVQESLSFDWEGKPDCPLDHQALAEHPINDLYWSPDGTHLILSLGARTVLFNVTDRKWLQLPDVIVLPYFEQLYGVSPCRPDNAGFLGWRMKAVPLESPFVRGTELQNPEKSFWDTASPVFVSWAGEVKEIATPARVRDADWLIHTAWRFPGQCQWDQHQLRFTLKNESLTIDTNTCEVQFEVKDEPAAMPEKRGEVIDSVVLNGGRVEVQLVQTKDPFEVYNRIPANNNFHDLSVRLQVLELATGVARPVDLGQWSQFRLVPSPDRNFVLVTNDAEHRKPGPSILLDADGRILHLFKYKANYLDTADAWYWEAADRLYGVPASLSSPSPEYGLKFGVGNLHDDYANGIRASDSTLEYMASVMGPLARVRELKGLSIHAERGLLTRDGLRHLKAFSQLQYLHVSGMTIRDSDLRHFEQLPQLEKLVFAKSVCTDEAIAALKQHLPKAEILHKWPAANGRQR